MDALEQLRLNRMSRAVSLSKGMNTNDLDIQKAHNVGDVHPNGKWVWAQLPNGKYDWRVIKKTSGQGNSTQTKPASQPTKKDNKELTIKYDTDSGVKDFKLSSHHDEESDETWYEGSVNNHRVRILQSKVGKNDSWNIEVDGGFITLDGKNVSYDSPEKAVKGFEEDYVAAVKKSKKEDTKTDTKKDETPSMTDEEIQSIFDKVGFEFHDVVMEFTDIDDLEDLTDSDKKLLQKLLDNGLVEDKQFDMTDYGADDEVEEYKNKMNAKGYKVFDIGGGTDTSVFMKIKDSKLQKVLSENQTKPASQAKEEPKPLAKKSQLPDFTPKIPQEIASLTSRSELQEAYRIVGEDRFKMIYKDDNDFVNRAFYQGSNPTPAQIEQQKRIIMTSLGRDIANPNNTNISKTQQIDNMKKYYEKKAKSEELQWRKNETLRFWSRPEGIKRKEEIEKRNKELSKLNDKNNVECANAVSKLLGIDAKNIRISVRKDYASAEIVARPDNNSGFGDITITRSEDKWHSNTYSMNIKVSSQDFDISKPDSAKMFEIYSKTLSGAYANSKKIESVFVQAQKIKGDITDEFWKLDHELVADYSEYEF